MSEKVRVIACRSFRKSTRSNAEESPANAEGFPCKAARLRRRGGHLRGWMGESGTTPDHRRTYFCNRNGQQIKLNGARLLR